MRINSKGQVTIPAELRHKHNLSEGDEVAVVERDGVLAIERAAGAPTRGYRLVQHMRGRANAAETAGMTTDELMALLRGD